MTRRRLRPRIIAYAVSAAAATACGALGSRRSAAITKPIPIALLAAHVAAGGRERPPVDNVLLAGVIGFSATGDRFMLNEEFETEPQAKDQNLRLGATLFAGAQLCYAATMWRRGARPEPRTLAPRGLLLAESAAVLALHRPRLLPVLGAYGQTLVLMSALASTTPTPQPQVRIGGLLFLASDLTIINRRHLLRHPRVRQAAEIWVLASYFAAQALLLDGVGRAADDGR
ncbi:lysoplasmalogenase [Gordonia sp. ABSL1-1]|uniref:lysoplasmalogenase n=1 Tax=Gordonia sp. ABSL1-1 TaxID=3053923 RepID=UPI002573F7C7|nr:lysoplasmalogenase [Gordonia sp. ABSL1-1]MDL9935693.1 lysoplasmalogenase [Gordonia sp. ABSL1-1]